MSAKNFIVRGGGDFSGIKRELDKTQKQLSNFKAGISKTLGKVAMILGTIGLGRLVVESTKYAMGVETAIGNINRNLGNNALAYKNWVDSNAKQLGIAKADAYKYGNTFSNMITGFAKDTKVAKDMTVELMTATAIISSKTGRTYDDTANRIRSGLLGSTEAIEDLGVYTQISMLESTEAFRKFAGDKSWAQLDFQTQQQIRVLSILEQTYDKYGTTLTDNTQTRHNQFMASLGNMKLALGNAFLPIYNTVLPALTRMVEGIGRAMNVIAQFVTALFGSATPFSMAGDEMSESADAASDLADNVSGAGSAAKKAGKDAKGALAGFDELNILSKPKADTGSGGSGGSGGAGTIEMPKIDTGEGLIGSVVEVSDKVKAFAEKIKSTFKSIKDTIVTNKVPIISAVSGIGVGIATYLGKSNWGVIVKGFASVFGSKGAIATAIGGISLPVAAIATVIGLVVAAIVSLWNKSDEFRGAVTKAWNGIKDTISNIYNTILKPIFEAFVGMLTDIYENGIKPLWEKWTEFINEVVLLMTDLWEGMKPVVDWIISVFGPAIVLIFEGLFKIIGTTIKAIIKVVGSLIENFKTIFEGVRLIFQGIIDFVTGVFTGDWDKAWGGVKKIFEGLTTAFESVWKTVKGVFETIVNWVKDTFTTSWDTAWTAVETIFTNIWESFKGIAKGPLNAVIDGVNTLIKGINKFKINIPPWVANLAGVTGGSIGFNIATIPRLAQGGYVGANSPQLAMIGDNMREGEIVAPESKIFEQVVKALQSTQQTGPIVLEIDGVQFGKLAANGIKKASRLAGVSLLEV